jgi:branched-chain amino acid transport system ATP-binding protein
MGILKVEELTKTFGGVIALSDVSFEVGAGQIFGLIGPNGSGKTTFFNVATGFLRPDKGRILYMGKDITGMPTHLIASMGIVRTYQNTSLFDGLTVAENVRIATHTKTKAGIWDAVLGTSRIKQERGYVEKKVRDLLSFAGLESKEEERADSLSYGDQRKLEIAVALAAGPKLLFLDEPAAGMNRAETDALAALVRELRSKEITVLIVEHNMTLMMELCDWILVLDYGVKLVEDIPENIVKNKEVIKVYFGEDLEFA